MYTTFKGEQTNVMVCTSVVLLTISVGKHFAQIVSHHGCCRLLILPWKLWESSFQGSTLAVNYSLPSSPDAASMFLKRKQTKKKYKKYVARSRAKIKKWALQASPLVTCYLGNPHVLGYHQCVFCHMLCVL